LSSPVHLSIESNHDLQEAPVIHFWDAVPSTLPWLGVLLAASSCMLTVYAGLALAVALFHPRGDVRRAAERLFEQLLNVLILRRPR